MEIERKFLVKNIPFELSQFKKSEISQTYISFSPVIRLRKLNEEYILTCKGKGSLAREEFELQISKEQYQNLLTKCEGRTIIKTRYYIPIQDNLTAELDIYHNDFLNSLVTVEVEFESTDEAQDFLPPVWFSIDVTFDPNYSNSALAQIK